MDLNADTEDAAVSNGGPSNPSHVPSGPLRLSHLWRPPTVRNYLENGQLFKEAKARQPSRLELFFDLAYAGIVHQLAERTSELPNGLGFARFIISFFPSWSIWKDTRDFGNISGTDDVHMRLYILVIMLLLYGYSANVSGIELEIGEDGHHHFTEGSYTAIHVAAIFYLLAKAMRLLYFIRYAFALPRFKVAFLISAVALVLNAAIFIPIAVPGHITAIYVFPLVALGLEIVSRYAQALFGKLHHDGKIFAGKESAVAIPAINVEHMMERTLQFVVIIFGETIISSTYIARAGEYGVHAEYGRSALAIIIAFSLIWLYFDSDSSRTYVHALRRHWLTNITYTWLHFPLTAAIILFSAALGVVIPEGHAEEGIKWFLAGGIATTLACIGLIGVLHRSMDQHRSGLLPRSVRLALRGVVAIFIACFPLFQPENMTITLGIVAAILGALVAVETFGKLGAVRLQEEHERKPKSQRSQARIAHQNEKSMKHWERHKDDLTEAERGEDDVGVETELGDMEVKDLHLSQRLAYTA